MLLCEGMALFDSPPGHTLLDYVIIHVLTFYSSVLKKNSNCTLTQPIVKLIFKTEW